MNYDQIKQIYIRQVNEITNNIESMEKELFLLKKKDTQNIEEFKINDNYIERNIKLVDDIVIKALNIKNIIEKFIYNEKRFGILNKNKIAFQQQIKLYQEIYQNVDTKVKEIQKSADDIFTNFKEIVEISESSNQFSTPRNNYNKIKKLKEYIQEKLNYIEIEESKIKNTKSSTEPELKIKNTKSFTEPELMVDGIVKKRKSKHKKF